MPDNSTDSGAAIRAALTCFNADGLAYKNVKFSTGTYKVTTGQLLLNKAKEMSGQVVAGAGLGITNSTMRLITDRRGGTIIKFADTSIDALVKVDTKDFYLSWVLKDLTLEGPGKTAGTNIHGLYFTNSNNTSSPSTFRTLLSNIAVTDVSGTGFRAYKFWSSRLDRCSAMNTGSHGIMMPGFTNTFDNCGQYNQNIGGISLWVLDESPTITAFNTGDCNIGMKFGVDVADKAAERLPDSLITTTPISCYPSIDRANIEPCTTYGIVMADGSNFIRGDNISISCFGGTTPEAAIWMKGPYRHPGEMRNLYINDNNTQWGLFNYHFKVDAGTHDPVAGLIIYCSSDKYYKWDPTKVTGDRACALIPIQTSQVGGVGNYTQPALQLPALTIGGQGGANNFTGSAYFSGDGALDIYPKTFDVTLTGANTTVVAAIPAKTRVLACTGLVIADVTGFADYTGFMVGVPAGVNRYAVNVGGTKNFSEWGLGNELNPEIIYSYLAATDLVFTATGGNFIRGTVRVTLICQTSRRPENVR